MEGETRALADGRSMQQVVERCPLSASSGHASTSKPPPRARQPCCASVCLPSRLRSAQFPRWTRGASCFRGESRLQPGRQEGAWKQHSAGLAPETRRWLRRRMLGWQAALRHPRSRRSDIWQMIRSSPPGSGSHTMDKADRSLRPKNTW
ncbi:hypothetical protein G6F57_013637 [Rhizopus arrhizus]|nr:hypothetical protein G6F57_013637 [Rhizopus arrhizus]